MLTPSLPSSCLPLALAAMHRRLLVSNHALAAENAELRARVDAQRKGTPVLPTRPKPAA